MKPVHAVLTLTRNNLELTKRAIESAALQTIKTSIWIIDNGSTDGTLEYYKQVGGILRAFPDNQGVSAGWNTGIPRLFSMGFEHVLVIGNDTILAPWTYSALLSANKPFVTGVDMGMDPLPSEPDISPLSPHPDFSCFLIRRECWEKVGPFDENMVSYASDCDYHVRAHRLGIPLWKASVPYNHERSSTMNRAPLDERVKLAEQAHHDREVFRSKYGCIPGTPEYSALFD